MSWKGWVQCPGALHCALASIKASLDDVHEVSPLCGRQWVKATIVSALPRTVTFVPARGSLFTKAWTNSSGPMCLSRSCMGRGEESERREGHMPGRRHMLGAIKGTIGNASVAGRCQLPSITSLCIYTEPPCAWGEVSSFLLPTWRSQLLLWKTGRAASPYFQSHVCGAQMASSLGLGRPHSEWHQNESSNPAPLSAA